MLDSFGMASYCIYNGSGLLGHIVSMLGIDLTILDGNSGYAVHAYEGEYVF